MRFQGAAGRDARRGAARAVQVTGTYIMVVGLGAVDPIARWAMMKSRRRFCRRARCARRQ